jgi:hypothetical protein
MSVVEVVTPEGRLLGKIDDLNQTVEMTAEWQKIAEKKRKRKKLREAKGNR